MNLSGIAVVVPPAQMDKAIFALNQLEHVEVFHTDPASGKIVVVQEATSVSAEINGLKKIKALPMVTYAEMVYHYFSEDPEFFAQAIDITDENGFEQTLQQLNQ